MKRSDLELEQDRQQGPPPGQRQLRLGDLIETALDEARKVSADPAQAAALAADAVARILIANGERRLAERLASS